ncbi:phosphotransferase enzyme family protein [Aspergillus ellipticus CBS 707.79]|uniref:Phosphotransferase enzyme family protein n=1 Tax=Aspergillus ellipticus CBS 707.79 TaxID=1448320 RepID=A0A319CTW3_9EURO|nr:phosphotransferase enzyme family protein [Aspergillus ellipticus CBS 707.79]
MTRFVEFPYYATNIPCPLPTIAEIDAACDISLDYGGRRVVEVGTHYVNTNVRVPRVYALYSNSDTGKNYIVMERIAGQTLLDVWSNLSISEKESIVTRLRGYLDELRKLSSPGYFGSLGRRTLLDDIFWTVKPEPAINSPFTTKEALIEAMVLKYTQDGRPPYRAEFYRQCLPGVLRDHVPTLTHGDFQRRNIIVCSKESGSTDGPDRPELEIAILDWAKSGWYPNYWEYCLAVCSLRWGNDWGLRLGKTLEPFPCESAWFADLRLELWY